MIFNALVARSGLMVKNLRRILGPFAKYVPEKSSVPYNTMDDLFEAFMKEEKDNNMCILKRKYPNIEFYITTAPISNNAITTTKL